MKPSLWNNIFLSKGRKESLLQLQKTYLDFIHFKKDTWVNDVEEAKGEVRAKIISWEILW